MAEKPQRSGTATLVRRLLFGVVAMFGFGFALVPLYDVICDITGLNGNTSNLKESTELAQAGVEVEDQRELTMQFLANPNAGDGWKFRASEPQLRLKPGETRLIHYTVTNPHDHPVVTRAVPSVAPGEASQYLNKIECFCFQEQPLEPGETVEMPLRFYIDPELPDRVSKLTLSYTLYDITGERDVASK